jgi:hypothetical protein
LAFRTDIGSFSICRSATNVKIRVVLRSRGCGQVPGKPKKKKQNRNQPHMVMFRHLSPADHAVRTLRSFALISSNGSGVIVLGAPSSSTVTSASDWANISQEYANYRVKAMRVLFTPSTTSATSSTGPYQGMFMISRWWGLVPTVESTLRQEDSSEFHSTLEEFSMETNYLGYREAQEWTPVGTAIPFPYGFCHMTPTGSSVLALSSNIYSRMLEFDVEFLNTQ